MGMPKNLFLVRHGLSEANVIQQADKNGSPISLTDDMVNVPDRSWRLTETGEQQAETIGEWIRQENNNLTIDRFITSPFTRTRETSAHLGFDYAEWEENRSIRERSWGEINTMTRKDFAQQYPLNSNLKKIDPLYWAPPAGESIANIAENRTRNVLEMLSRENSGDNVILTTHGEFMWSCRLIIERWSDEDFVENDSNPDFRLHNCIAIHYTTISPETNEDNEDLAWVRTAYPKFNNSTQSWDVVVSDFENFGRKYYSNDELLSKVRKLERFF